MNILDKIIESLHIHILLFFFHYLFKLQFHSSYYWQKLGRKKLLPSTISAIRGGVCDSINILFLD